MNILACTLQDTPADVYRRLWKNSVQYSVNGVSSIDEGMARVLKEDYVFLEEVSAIAPIAFNDCRYIIGKKEFSPDNFAFVFPKNSPYLPAVNKR